MSSTKNQIIALKSALSAARINTYEIAAGITGNEDLSWLNLYLWNAQISGEFLTPLHICEVVIRNAVADAIEQQYGNQWPWSKTFQTSLPSSSFLKVYNPQKNLCDVSKKQVTVGKVIPKLNFMFWQKMFTKRHDVRLWNKYLLNVMPGCDKAQSIKNLRQSIFQDIDTVRELRNRIAHHEPIFKRDLANDYNTIIRLITYRSQETADWIFLNHYGRIQEILNKKPKIIIV